MHVLTVSCSENPLQKKVDQVEYRAQAALESGRIRKMMKRI